jgi:hypothetical protein
VPPPDTNPYSSDQTSTPDVASPAEPYMHMPLDGVDDGLPNGDPDCPHSPPARTRIVVSDGNDVMSTPAC